MNYLYQTPFGSGISASHPWSLVYGPSDWNQLWLNFRIVPGWTSGALGDGAPEDDSPPDPEDGGTTGADLALTQSDSPDPVAIGSNLVYTLTLVNNGPDQANNVQVADTLPTGVTFVSTTQIRVHILSMTTDSLSSMWRTRQRGSGYYNYHRNSR